MARTPKEWVACASYAAECLNQKIPINRYYKAVNHWKGTVEDEISCEGVDSEIIQFANKKWDVGAMKIRWVSL